MGRDFKGVWIPKEVWLDKRLNALDKVILTEIDSLDQGEKGCFSGNQYLADFCQCSERKISDSVSKLIKYGYIEQIGFDGRKRYLRSRLAFFASQESKTSEAEPQNLRTNNIDNNTDNNTNKKDIVPYTEIIMYLNNRTGAAYRASSKKTKDLIKARFNEGFTLEDFKTVIDKKSDEWLDDRNMSKFLRPETLFGTKFESYLNQPVKKKTTKDLAKGMDFGFMGDVL